MENLPAEFVVCEQCIELIRQNDCRTLTRTMLASKAIGLSDAKTILLYRKQRPHRQEVIKTLRLSWQSYGYSKSGTQEASKSFSEWVREILRTANRKNNG